jgi:peptidoglycan/xylan/chitin deacetylase (PgdA/CDA1 family)/GT2 family glycosyltransferase
LSHASSPPAALRFSVVVPTFERRAVVLASVRALAAQELKSFEVVVVVDGSTDGSTQALRELDVPFSLTVVEQPNSGRASAVNRGAAEARGELLLFLDDDMEAHPRLLLEHDRSHRRGADVVLGDIPLHPDSPSTFLSAAVGAWAGERSKALLEGDKPLALHDLLSGQMSMRRELFLRVGCFDSDFTRGGTFGMEDLDLGLRLASGGYRIEYNAEAISWQRYVVTPRQYLRQWRQVGRAHVLFVRKHPDQADRVFVPRRLESAVDHVLWRRLRWPLRELALLLAAAGARGPRATRWFYRVRNLEYQQGIREAGGVPGPNRVRVLCYHSISDLAGAGALEPYGVPASHFRWQVDLLSRYFHFIGSEEFGRFLAGAGVPRRALLLTFDDCYRDLLEQALPILRERRIPALAFAVSRYVGQTNAWDARLGAPPLPLLGASGLRALVADGIAVGSHSRSHRMLNRLPPAELADELRGSADDLEGLGLGRPGFLAYPHGEHDAAVQRAAADAGYSGAFTISGGIFSRGAEPYAIERIEILRSDTGLSFLWKVFTGRRRRGHASRS